MNQVEKLASELAYLRARIDKLETLEYAGSAANADKVDGIHAATTATANKLCALNASAEGSFDIVGTQGGAVGIMNRYVYYLTNYTDHFTSGVIPAGYSWVVGAPWNGTPAALNYSYRSDYCIFTAGGAGTRVFLQQAITNAAASWQGKNVTGRFGVGLVTKIGVRFDLGDDNEYAEVYLDGAGGVGVSTPVFAYRLAGGAVVTVPSAIALPTGTFIGLSVTCYYASGSGLYYYYGYIYNETGQNNVAGWVVAATPGAIPAAGRAGLVASNTGIGNYGQCDWFYNSFT